MPQNYATTSTKFLIVKEPDDIRLMFGAHMCDGPDKQKTLDILVIAEAELKFLSWQIVRNVVKLENTRIGRLSASRSERL